MYNPNGAGDVIVTAWSVGGDMAIR
jgi:hypothetical protein